MSGSRLNDSGRGDLITEISAGLGSLKAAKDILQAMNGVQTAAAVNEVKLTLQGHMLDAQGSLFTAQQTETSLTTRIRELEQEIVQLKDWSTEKQRYQLHDAGRGAMVYVPKFGMEDGEAPHWLCVRCFQQGTKSFLQNKGNGVGNRSTADRGSNQNYQCDICKGGFQVSWRTSPSSDRDARLQGAGQPQGIVI